jgi:pilus assembly protein CpaD
MTMRKFGLTTAILMPLVGLGGCSGGPEIDDNYQPAMHYERYPIEVAKGSVRLDVPTKRAELGMRMEDAVVGFAHEAISVGAREIRVQEPHGPNSSVVAGRVTELLVDNGVPAEAIAHTDYQAGRGAPVIISFQRKIAVTAECGDWSADLAVTGTNEPPPNFGCAQQHNIAAVVANPEDFEVPRTSTPPDASRRNQVFVDYRKPKNTATSVSESETQVVSDVAQ